MTDSTKSAQWIPVSERLPIEEDGDVLIYHILGDRDRPEVPHAFDVAIRINGEWVLPWDRDGKNYIAWVTHWMPLPPPPSDSPPR